ncbi:MAG: hypothetical protein WCQ32_01815 [bacterium]
MKKTISFTLIIVVVLSIIFFTKNLSNENSNTGKKIKPNYYSVKITSTDSIKKIYRKVLKEKFPNDTFEEVLQKATKE